MLSLLVTLQILASDVRDKVGRRLAEEKGASTVEWVIITGFLIVLAAPFTAWYPMPLTASKHPPSATRARSVPS